MKILLIGSGGREHALAWKLSQSTHCEILFALPGNPGMAGEEKIEVVGLGMDDHQAIENFARDNHIDLVVIGPEAPLVGGLGDLLRQSGFAVFGPGQKAAQLEGSKSFTKDLCSRYNIPTAQAGTFTEIDAAHDFIDKHGAPIVVKADGLAAGKGVIIAEDEDTAKRAVSDMLAANGEGQSGARVVIEEFLEGEEVSVFAISDGKTLLPLTSAQDHKRIGEGDTGPNTGGMGAYSPAPVLTPAIEAKVRERILSPTLQGMADMGCPFTGVLFAGLMIVNGDPYLLEYNVRFGDPECQSLMMRLDSDLAVLLHDAATGQLEGWQDKLAWKDSVALCVVMAAGGYPGTYSKGDAISGLDAAAKMADVKVFHAGTARDDAGDILTNGGRVLGVCATGDDIAAAYDQAYRACAVISWDNMHYRKDIGWRALEALKSA